MWLSMVSDISFQQKTEKQGIFAVEQNFLHIKPHQNTEAEWKLKTLVLFCVNYARNTNIENRQFGFSDF